MKHYFYKNFFRAVVCTAALLTFNCSPNEEAPPVFIPQIDGTYGNFVNTENSEDVFSFSVTTPGVPSSTFSGSEQILNTARYTFKGSYTEHSIEFTYDKDNPFSIANKHYEGIINDSSTVITLHGLDSDSIPLPSKTLRRQ